MVSVVVVLVGLAATTPRAWAATSEEIGRIRSKNLCPVHNVDSDVRREVLGSAASMLQVRSSEVRNNATTVVHVDHVAMTRFNNTMRQLAQQNTELEALLNEVKQYMSEALHDLKEAGKVAWKDVIKAAAVTKRELQALAERVIEELKKLWTKIEEMFEENDVTKAIKAFLGGDIITGITTLATVDWDQFSESFVAITGELKGLANNLHIFGEIADIASNLFNKIMVAVVELVDVAKHADWYTDFEERYENIRQKAIDEWGSTEAFKLALETAHKVLAKDLAGAKASLLNLLGAVRVLIVEQFRKVKNGFTEAPKLTKLAEATSNELRGVGDETDSGLREICKESGGSGCMDRGTGFFCGGRRRNSIGSATSSFCR